MINPANIFRVVGFIKKDTQEILQEPQEGGLALCYTDYGSPIVIELKSNKTETSLEDINAFLINKRDSVIKSKDIELLASELAYDEEFNKQFFEAENEFKQGNPAADFKTLMGFKKEFTEGRAKEMITNERTIRGGSIMKAASSLTNNINEHTYTFGKATLPKISSRSLIFDDNGPTVKGFYYYSQLENSLPISIKRVFNREGEALSFFKATLSKVATLAHFNYLASHIVRTIKKQMEDGKIYLNAPEYNYNKIKNNYPLMTLVKKLVDLGKIKDPAVKVGEDFLVAFLDLINYVNSNPKSLIHINLVLNLPLSDKDFKKIVKEKPSPLTNMRKSFVNLNYSKEDPETKEDLGKIVDSFIDDILDGRRRGEILTTYFTMPVSLTEEPSSWGFMSNNIQREAFVLSLLDTIELSKVLDSALENIKNV